MNQAEIQQQVRNYLVEAYLPPDKGENLSDDEDLLKVLNSLQLLRMVIEVESMFGIAIENSELAPENLGSVGNIAAFIERKQSG